MILKIVFLRSESYFICIAIHLVLWSKKHFLENDNHFMILIDWSVSEPFGGWLYLEFFMKKVWGKDFSQETYASSYFLPKGPDYSRDKIIWKAEKWDQDVYPVFSFRRQKDFLLLIFRGDFIDETVCWKKAFDSDIEYLIDQSKACFTIKGVQTKVSFLLWEKDWVQIF